MKGPQRCKRVLSAPGAARRVFLVRRKTNPKLADMPRHDSIAHDITRPIVPAEVVAPPISHANFSIGDVVRHRLFDFRGVIFDVDPVFANSDEWYAAIPEDIRPRKDQPFYHLLAENMESSYVAYVSQQNLVPDDSDEPVDHPAIDGLFSEYADGRYALRQVHRH